MSKLVTLVGGLIGGLTGAGAVGVAVSSISAAAPAALVPYAATQVGLGYLGITSLLGGAAATSSAVALIGGPIVVATSAIAIPTLGCSALAYGLYKTLSK